MRHAGEPFAMRARPVAASKIAMAEVRGALAVASRPARLAASSSLAMMAIIAEGIQEHQLCPDRSSKKALSAAFPPDCFMAWKSAWIACSRSISGGVPLIAANSRSTASGPLRLRSVP
jgi:hypothetical protein